MAPEPVERMQVPGRTALGLETCVAKDLDDVRSNIRAALNPTGRTPHEAASARTMARSMAEKYGLVEEFFPTKPRYSPQQQEAIRQADAWLRGVSQHDRVQREVNRRVEQARVERVNAEQARVRRSAAEAIRQMERQLQHRQASVSFLAWTASLVASEAILLAVVLSVLTRGGPWTTVAGLVIFMVLGVYVHVPHIDKYAKLVTATKQN